MATAIWRGRNRAEGIGSGSGSVSISQECFSSVWKMWRKTARRRRVSGLRRTSRNAIKIVHQLQLNVSLVYSFCSLRHMIYSYALWSDLYAITIAIRVRQSKVHFAMKRILYLREVQCRTGIKFFVGFKVYFNNVFVSKKVWLSYGRDKIRNLV